MLKTFQVEVKYLTVCLRIEKLHVEPDQVNYLKFQVMYLNLLKTVSTVGLYHQYKRPPRSVLSAVKHHNLCTGLETVVFRPCHWKCITVLKIGEIVKKWSDFNFQRTRSYVLSSRLQCKLCTVVQQLLLLLLQLNITGAKFHQNWVSTATVGGWSGQTDRQTDRRDRRGWSYNLCHAVLHQWNR